MSIIKSFSVGDGDMFYIKHNTDNFTVIDCCYSTDNNWTNQLDEIAKQRQGKNICRFISTHPDEDHIKGLKDYNSRFGIVNFYCVANEASKSDETEDFKEYKKLRDDENKAFYLYKGCSRKWMNCSDDERGSAGINCLWPIRENGDFKTELELAKEGTSFNNISPVITYSLNNGVKAIWFGDMENVFLEKIKKEVNWPEVDILFAPHHGRESGKVSSDILEILNPKIIVIGEAPSKHLNYYDGYNTLTQNSSGSIVFKNEIGKTHVFIENAYYPYDTSFLENEKISDYELGYYIGTFATKS